jgi:hypothetical protein
MHITTENLHLIPLHKKFVEPLPGILDSVQQLSNVVQSKKSSIQDEAGRARYVLLQKQKSGYLLNFEIKGV